MTDNYLKLARANLERLYGNLPEDLEKCLPAEKDGHGDVQHRHPRPGPGVQGPPV